MALLLCAIVSLLGACGGGGGGDGGAGDDVTGPPKVPLIFQSTFDCLDWIQDPPTLGHGSDANVCSSGDGIEGYGDWTTVSGSKDQIIAAANNPSGGGGKGFRHWREDGNNNNGGGLRITLPAPVTEMWVRLYMRFSDGFTWTGGAPNYTKDMYWNVGAAFLIFGHQGGGWGLHSNVGSQNIPSSSKWANTPPGQWHLYEYHVKQAGGVVEVWVNGQQVLSRTGVNLGTATWDYFVLGENQCCVATGGYTDYDDIAISIVGRVGPH